MSIAIENARVPRGVALAVIAHNRDLCAAAEGFRAFLEFDSVTHERFRFLNAE